MSSSSTGSAMLTTNSPHPHHHHHNNMIRIQNHLSFGTLASPELNHFSSPFSQPQQALIIDHQQNQNNIGMNINNNTITNLQNNHQQPPMDYLLMGSHYLPIIRDYNVLKPIVEGVSPSSSSSSSPDTITSTTLSPSSLPSHPIMNVVVDQQQQQQQDSSRSHISHSYSSSPSGSSMSRS